MLISTCIEMIHGYRNDLFFTHGVTFKIFSNIFNFLEKFENAFPQFFYENTIFFSKSLRNLIKSIIKK